jgi:hypothetical protein
MHAASTWPRVSPYSRASASTRSTLRGGSLYVIPTSPPATPDVATRFSGLHPYPIEVDCRFPEVSCAPRPVRAEITRFLEVTGQFPFCLHA